VVAVEAVVQVVKVEILTLALLQVPFQKVELVVVDY
jgi:hypothetical protein